MLGVCNTCVGLQSRVTSSGSTVDDLCFFYFLFPICFCLFFLVVVFLYFFVVVVGFLLFYLFVYLFFIRDGGGTKIGFFTGGWVIGVEALIRRILGVLGELGIIISAGQSNWEFSCFG